MSTFEVRVCAFKSLRWAHLRARLGKRLSGLGLDSGVHKLKPSGAVDLTVTATPAGTAFTAQRLLEGLTLTRTAACPAPGPRRFLSSR